MGSVKDLLEKRQRELRRKLSGYQETVSELEEVTKLLESLEGCTGCPSGCGECRTGPNYR